ncbi:hypothetical protein [Sulfurimonas sp. HSL3-7]|uniref:hypothetical protein n=1 Tax=Sulfonitrofixus jiaomeiensis TaxID=3131938 RepID=UPI0031F8EE40
MKASACSHKTNKKKEEGVRNAKAGLGFVAIDLLRDDLVLAGNKGSGLQSSISSKEKRKRYKVLTITHA